MTVAQLSGFQAIVCTDVTGAQERIVALMNEAGTVLLSTKTFRA